MIWRFALVNLRAGVEVKDLGASDGRFKPLVRFAADASISLHKHEDPEFIYLLEGDAMQIGHKLHAGWSGVAAKGIHD